MNSTNKTQVNKTTEVNNTVEVLLTKKMDQLNIENKNIEEEHNSKIAEKIVEKEEIIIKKRKKKKKKKMSYKNMMAEILKPSGNNDIKDKKIITRGLGGGRYSKLNKI